VLIEFIGLPGSGKTTYLKKIIEKDTITREKIEQMKIPIRMELAFYFSEWKLFVLFAAGVCYNFEFRIKRWYALIIGVRATFKQYAYVYNCAKKNEITSIVLDEGLYQRALSVFSYNERKYNERLLKIVVKRINHLNIINAVYFFEISVKESIARCNGREGGLPFRFQSFNGVELDKRMNIFYKGIINLIKTMKPELTIIR